ncbi:major facilitator superfamily domain-containing protein [Phyllosticta capitalensis]|uniref:Major facilitator superfamily domain-containing protein n=1 Tax=Phyllosticta capitalensis TaxID=121624 RepID=A0ABR1Z2V4_9PEZI
MSDLIRDAPIGQIIRYFSGNRLLQYPEERPDYQLPPTYSSRRVSLPEDQSHTKEAESAPQSPNLDKEQEDKESSDTEEEESDTEKFASDQSTRTGVPSLKKSTSGIEKVDTRTAPQTDLERQVTTATLKKSVSQPIKPKKLDDGTVLVDWYDTDDPANPQNWTFGKKTFAAFQIYIYTLAVYMGSAIYAPSEQGVMNAFGVSIQQSAMGLSLYVAAYGIGPLLWSPLSEIPFIGRNPPYLITFGIFVILLVPDALAPNFDTLMAMRFLLGFFGSPCLATGGASLQDLYSFIKLPYALSVWALAATCGPALGPIISGFSVAAKNWRWSQWEMLWLSGPVWVVMFLFLPETSASKILLRRAQRLRRATGNMNFKSQSEIDQANMKVHDVVVEALWRPFQLILLDPSIAFTAVYVALVYGIYYSFFEAFPLVYVEMYHMTLGEMGLTFLSITVGVLIAIGTYWPYIYYIVEPEIKQHGLGAPERRLIPALVVCFLCPIGLFLFGWTAKASIHWIVSVIGVGIFTTGVFLLIQCIFLYLPLSYPQYAASLFAGNDFLRSAVAAGAIHFARPLFNNLGIGPGVSLLAAFTVVCCGGIFVLYYYGAKLRARSRFTVKTAA